MSAQSQASCNDATGITQILIRYLEGHHYGHADHRSMERAGRLDPLHAPALLIGDELQLELTRFRGRFMAWVSSRVLDTYRPLVVDG